MMRIGILSPYPEFTTLARELSRELGLQSLVEDGVLEEGVRIAQRWERERTVDVIVVRGPTGVMVRKVTSLPVTMINISAYDMLDALYRSRKVGGQVALVAYDQKRRDYDLAHLSEIADLQFQPFLYKTMSELEQQLDRAGREGNTVIVGTGICITRSAEKRGLCGILVHSGREALVEALGHAVSQVRLAEQEKARARRAQAILDVSSDGILSLDEHGLAVIFNRSAERLLGRPASKVLGRSGKDLVGDAQIGPLLGDQSELRAELVNAGGNTWVVNRVPLGSGNLVISFQAATQIQTLEEKIRRQLHQKGLVARYSFAELVGESPAFKRALERGRQFATTDLTVLLTGESGTGKELFAHAIHLTSQRAKGPFVAVNCGALPENLLESELFGYEEGAFTGARKGGKIGLFELSHGGTIFLDEIGELDMGLQSRLLRVLQSREVMRVGGDRLIPVDVRVVAATNRDLSVGVQEHRFREDLYYRINVLNIHLPALRDRAQDVRLLARHLLPATVRLTPSDLKLLEGHDWPGNVRELENLLQRYAVLGASSGNTSDGLMSELIREVKQSRLRSAPDKSGVYVELGSLDEMESELLRQAQDKLGLDRVALARFLGVSRTTLWKKLGTIVALAKE